MFNFLKNCQGVFQNDFIVLYTQQQCMRLLVAVRFLQHFVFVLYLVPSYCYFLSCHYFFGASILPLLTSFLLIRYFFVLNFNFPNDFLAALLIIFKDCSGNYNVFLLWSTWRLCFTISV